MKQYPQFKTWQGLKGKESIFKSPESGSQGMFLGGAMAGARLVGFPSCARPAQTD